MKIYFAVAAAAAMLVGSLPVAAQIPGTASDDVPAAIAARARRVAENAPKLKARLIEPRMVFVGVELVRRKSDEGRELEPLYRVNYYRYADDTAVAALVELGGEVREVEETPHGPMALSAPELVEARGLALADRNVGRALERFRDRLTIEPLVVRTSDPEDPWFGRRIVRLLFRVGADYLSEPVVFVDLTRREVIVQRAHGDNQ
jgi:hypothetical protein